MFSCTAAFAAVAARITTRVFVVVGVRRAREVQVFVSINAKVGMVGSSP
jgi:hypothetical protein